MFEKVALALDGSDNSEAAVPVATELAERFDAKVVVIHIDERTVAKGDMPPVHPDEENLLKRVQDHVDAMSAAGIDTSLSLDSVVLGGPGARIAAIAAEEGAELIIAGSRGESALKGMLLGSVAHKLLHLSEVPVLIVPTR
jgi:nucleotide-binding universal stress UspA family protein